MLVRSPLASTHGGSLGFAGIMKKCTGEIKQGLHPSCLLNEMLQKDLNKKRDTITFHHLYLDITMTEIYQYRRQNTYTVMDL